MESLRTATTRPLEVVLADNGSIDGVPEKAAAQHANVRLLPTGGNIGYGAAANAGLAGQTAGYALVANPDVRFEPGAIDELLGGGSSVATGGDRRSCHPDAQGRAVSLGAGLSPTVHRCRSRLARLGVAGNPWTARYRREREEPRERTAAGCPAPVCSWTSRHSGRWGDSIPGTSCTSRTSTSPNGSVGGDGCTSMHRRRWLYTRAVTRHVASHTACSGSTTRAPCVTSPGSTRSAGTRLSGARCEWLGRPDAGLLAEWPRRCRRPVPATSQRYRPGARARPEG